MGLAKDIYDIFSENKELKSKLGEGIVKFYKKAEKSFWRKPKTVKERVEGLQLLLQKMKEPSFDENFKSRLDYFGLLLAIIAECSHIKNHGCLIEDFYNSDYYLYFPYSTEEPRLQKGKITKGPLAKDILNARGLVKSKKSYAFYCLKKEMISASFSQLQDKLEKIVRSGLTISEEEQFIKYLETIGYEALISMTAIVQLSGGAFQFYEPASFFDNKITLSWFTPNDTRYSMVRDIEHILRFK